MYITGRTHYRYSFFKKLVLQVEVSDNMGYNKVGPEYKYLRDATIEDIFTLADLGIHLTSRRI